MLHVVFVVAGFIPGYERRWLAFSAVLAAWRPCCCRRPLFWLLLLLLHMVPCLPLLMPSAYCSFNFLSASSLVACCFSACAFYCCLCSCLFTLAIRLSSCCWIPLWIFAFCCSLINLYKRLNKQCLTLFFFPPTICPFTFLLGHGRWGPLLGGGLGVRGSSHIGVSSPIGCGLALVFFVYEVCCLYIRWICWISGGVCCRSHPLRLLGSHPMWSSLSSHPRRLPEGRLLRLLV